MPENNPLQNCVTCGLCLPVCPTYQLHKVETESPRGRILMMRAAAENKNGAAFLPAIDSCLGCMACEAACPVAVPVAALSAAYRAKYGPTSRRKLLPNALRFFAVRPRLQFILRRFLSFALYCEKVIPSFSELPKPQKKFPRKNYLPQKNNGEVFLFVGCLSELLDGDTLRAAVKTLNAAGLSVRIPKNQTCCGALFSDAGEFATADFCGRQNAAAFCADSVSVNKTDSSFPRRRESHAIPHSPMLNDESHAISHPPPLAGGGKIPLGILGGGKIPGVNENHRVAATVSTPRDFAYANSHPPPQAAGGEKIVAGGESSPAAGDGRLDSRRRRNDELVKGDSRLRGNDESVDICGNDQGWADSVSTPCSFPRRRESIVVHCTSGCRYSLAKSGIESRDICEVVNSQKGLLFAPAEQKVFLHIPCSQKNDDPAATIATRDLLQKIPRLEIVELPQNNVCCGAAGVYHLAEKNNARRLRENKLLAWKTALGETKNPLILSSNYGCARFLFATLKREKPQARIIHPIQFAAECLADK